MDIPDELGILQINFNEAMKKILANIPNDEVEKKLKLVAFGIAVSAEFDLTINFISGKKDQNDKLILDTISKLLTKTIPSDYNTKTH